MTTVIEHRLRHPDAVQILADFSPPRGADPALLEQTQYPDADFIAVNYSPGKSARVNSAFAAAWIKHNIGKDVTFSLATRDMNRVALQGLLMGANLMGLQNVIALKGDPFSERELAITKPVDDYLPTGLIHAISDMNRGIDYKGLKLLNPTNFCIGATIDLGRDTDRQIALTRKKAQAGAQFFLLQPLFSPDTLTEFLERYAQRYGERLAAFIYCGVHILVQDGITFGEVPHWAASALRRGRSGEDLAVELTARYLDAGHRSIYLLAPVHQGGRRDYAACRRVIDRIRRL